MIISRKRFEAEVEKRVKEAIAQVEENHWRNERDREHWRAFDKLHERLIECEKKCGIDHPSHHRPEIFSLNG